MNGLRTWAMRCAVSSSGVKRSAFCACRSTCCLWWCCSSSHTCSHSCCRSLCFRRSQFHRILLYWKHIDYNLYKRLNQTPWVDKKRLKQTSHGIQRRVKPYKLPFPFKGFKQKKRKKTWKKEKMKKSLKPNPNGSHQPPFGLKGGVKPNPFGFKSGLIQTQR